MSKIILVIILSIQLLTVIAFYPESYDVDIHTAIQKSLYLRYILENSSYIKVCHQDLWCVEKEEPIKIHELINNNEQLNMSNDNEMNVMCIFCFNPRNLEAVQRPTQYEELQLFSKGHKGCYVYNQTKKVPYGCKCSELN
ncbi:uncharacterized protein LOC135133776 isoform X1 [Zophobas morio]|uniref:uncharacterized protein LOC135133776 isoform X1 n=1 Tax=Zophobas morio TaxID=2755281 RepID=UPI003082E30A